MKNLYLLTIVFFFLICFNIVLIEKPTEHKDVPQQHKCLKRSILCGRRVIMLVVLHFKVYFKTFSLKSYELMNYEYHLLKNRG